MSTIKPGSYTITVKDIKNNVTVLSWDVIIPDDTRDPYNYLLGAVELCIEDGAFVYEEIDFFSVAKIAVDNLGWDTDIALSKGTWCVNVTPKTTIQHSHSGTIIAPAYRK